MFRNGRYANVTATLALVIALGGTSYAALSITGRNVRDNSLTGRDIKNNSLTAQDIRNNSVSSTDVRDGSLRAKDFKAGQLPARSKITLRVGAPGLVPPGQAGSATVTCAADERATGGGAIYDPQSMRVESNAPVAPPGQTTDASGGVTPTGWTVSATGTLPPGNQPQPLRAYVICST